MKKYLLLTAIAAFSVNLYGQTTAQDWTRTDCDGGSHHLFGELESGNVVVLEFIMTNCAPCVTAGNGLKSVVEPYANSHPNKVRLYSIGYQDSYTCTDMKNWRDNAGFTHTVFTGGQDEVTYYGGMGMPTIVVVGGWSHKVFYKQQGYAPSHNTAIKAAIDEALQNAAGILEPSEQISFAVYPNPAVEILNIKLPTQASKISIKDMLGREVLKLDITGNKEAEKVDVRNLTPGLYSVSLLSNGTVLTSKVFVKD